MYTAFLTASIVSALLAIARPLMARDPLRRKRRRPAPARRPRRAPARRDRRRTTAKARRR